MPTKIQKKNGFTLIELLVVISIIGLLSSIVITQLNGARIKSRDTARKAQMAEIRSALELYYNDNGHYPLSIPSGGSSPTWLSSEPENLSEYNNGDYIPGLAPKYIGALPRDPRGGRSTIAPGICYDPNSSWGWRSAYLYASWNNGLGYKLLSMCAPEGTWDSSDTFYDPGRPTFARMICGGQGSCNW